MIMEPLNEQQIAEIVSLGKEKKESGRDNNRLKVHRIPTQRARTGQWTHTNQDDPQ